MYHDPQQVRSPDTDVFILSIKYASRIKKNLVMDTGHSNKCRLIDVKSIAQELGPDLWFALLSPHAFTGCHNQCICEEGEACPNAPPDEQWGVYSML